MWRALAAVLVGCVLCGCGESDDKGAAAAAAAAPTSGVEVVYQKVSDFMAAGATNEAVACAAEAVDGDRYPGSRPPLLDMLLRLLLQADRVDEARARFRAELAREDKEGVRQCLGLITGYYRQRADAEGAIAWMGELLAAGLPADLRSRVFEWRLHAVLEARPFDELLALVPACVEQFADAEAARILSGLVQALLRANRYDEAGQAADRIAAAAGDRMEVRRVAAVAQMDVLAATGQWDALSAALAREAAGLPDPTLAGLFSRSVARATSAKGFDRADALCVQVLDTVTDRPQTRERAAQQWVASARGRGDVAAIPVRLAELRRKGLAAPSVLRLFRSCFYDVLNSTNRADLTAMVAVGDGLSGALEAQSDRDDVKNLLLDGAFVLEDYDRAIELVSSGVPERDEAWQNMALSKLRAHKALKEGRPREAVEHFRAFMACIATQAEPEADPSTGLLHTREMTLGRNARRIAEILASAGDAAGAQAAYNEAREYYEKALKELKPGSGEAVLVGKELAGLPAPPPAPEDK